MYFEGGGFLWWWSTEVLEPCLVVNVPLTCARLTGGSSDQMLDERWF